MKCNAFIRFDTYHDYIDFLNILDIVPGETVTLDRFSIFVRGDYPELRSIDVVFEGCDDE